MSTRESLFGTESQNNQTIVHFIMSSNSLTTLRQSTNKQTIEGYESHGSAGCLNSAEWHICVQPGPNTCSRAISEFRYYATSTSSVHHRKLIVLCLLTGEVEIRNKHRIQVTGITKSLFWLRSIFGRYKKTSPKRPKWRLGPPSLLFGGKWRLFPRW
jgi:hypothetical protein